MEHENYFSIPHREGYWDIDDYNLYYRAFGSGDEVMLVINGGPGQSCEFVAPLAQHGGDNRTVYLYDQFGCGRSDRPAQGDFDRYAINHYRDEVESIRQALGVEEVILYGQSWGSMVALEYALAYPEYVSKLVISGGLHDVEDALEVMKSAREEELTESELERAREMEAERDFDDPEYQKLEEKVWKKRINRTDPWPVWMRKTDRNTDIYGLMWGASEYFVPENARLRGWSVKKQLGDISAPTLVLVGEHDEIGPEIARDIADRIPDAQLHIIEDASHHTFWEKPEEHYDAVESFLE